MKEVCSTPEKKAPPKELTFKQQISSGNLVIFGVSGKHGSEPRLKEPDDEEMKDTQSRYPQSMSSVEGMALKSGQANQQKIADTTDLMWEDAAIDKEAKRFLKVKENGRNLPMDIVAHLDFFYNTLLLSHETTNPFKKSRTYQALTFPVFAKGSNGGSPTDPRANTILDVHRRLIYPL